MNSRSIIRRTAKSRTPCKGLAPWNVWALMALLCISVQVMAQEAPGYVSQGYTDQVINRIARFFDLNPGSKNLAQEVAFFSDDIDVRHIAFSPDGKYLAVTSMDDLSTHGQEVHIWDWRQEKLIRALYLPQGAGGDPLAKEMLTWSPDGKFLATCMITPRNNEASIRVWNVSDWTVEKDIGIHGDGNCTSLAFSPDSQLLIRIADYQDKGEDGVLIYDAHTWQKVQGFKLVPYFSPSVMSLSSSGQLMAVAGTFAVPHSGTIQTQAFLNDADNGGAVLVYDIKTDALLRNIRIKSETTNKIFSMLTPSSEAISPDGQYVMVGGDVNTKPSPYNQFPALSIYSVKTGQKVDAIHEHDSADIVSIRFLHHGQYLVVSEVDGYIQFWKFPEMRLVQEVKGEASSLAVSPDGQYLAGGGYKKILVWKIN